MLSLLVLSIVLIILGFFIGEILQLEVGGAVSTIIGVVMFIITSCSWFLIYNENSQIIREYHSTKATISEMRRSPSSEQVGISSKVIEINNKIANLKYWNQTFFQDTIPNEIDTLEPLQ